MDVVNEVSIFKTIRNLPDCNDYITGGFCPFFIHANDTKNAPGYGYMVVFVSPFDYGGSTTPNLTQVVFPYLDSDHKIYTRSIYSGSWGSWGAV